MSKHLAELCTLLVDDLYGHLPSRIISILLSYGRLTLPHIIQKSRLPPRYVKSGLAILIQRNLVLYHNPDDDNSTYYEADARNAYDLVRAGKTVQTLSGALQISVSEVTEKFVFDGSVTASQIMALQNTPKPTTNGVHHSQKRVNGNHQGGFGPARECEAGKVRDLIFSGLWAVKARQLDYVPEHDLEVQVETQTLEGWPGQAVKPKDRDGFISSVRSELRGRRNDNRVEADTFKSLDRKRDVDRREVDPSFDGATDERPRKQRKLNGGRGYDGGANGDEKLASPKHRVNGRSASPGPVQPEQRQTSPELQRPKADEDLAFRLNPQKLDVARRNEHATRLAATCLDSSVVCVVYRTLLRCATANIRCCYDPYSDNLDAGVAEDSAAVEDDEGGYNLGSAPVSAAQVEKDLPPHVQLASFLGEKEKRTKVKSEGGDGSAGKRVPPQENGVDNADEDHDSSESYIDRSRRVGHVTAILDILAAHPRKLLHRTSNESDRRYRVDFKTMAETLIQIQLEQLIEARFGKLAVLVIRQLRAMGKLDEKTIAGACIVQVKQVREALSAMQAAGLVDAQEIPKDSMRMPSKTIFLWYFDQERCRRLVINETYKGMCRLLQRRRVEKEKVQSVIDKSERTDVRGHEDEYLSEGEKKALAEWQGKEEKILVQVSRLDDMIAVMRDFLPPAMM